jgi:hypothetical protein
MRRLPLEIEDDVDSLFSALDAARFARHAVEWSSGILSLRRLTVT